MVSLTKIVGEFASERLQWLVALIAFGAALWFCLVEVWGLPLDDAWIHATLARSLAEHGAYTLSQGLPTKAVTSPLFTWIVAIGIALCDDPVVTVRLFCGIAHAFLALSLFRLLASYGFGKFVSFAGALYASLSGPILWLSASGMETSLFVALLCFSLAEIAREKWLRAAMGLALAVFTRVEGVVLLVPLVFHAVRSRSSRAYCALLIASAAVIAYGLWNLMRCGVLLPTTYLAKRFGYGATEAGFLGFFDNAWFLLKAWFEYYAIALGRNGLFGTVPAVAVTVVAGILLAPRRLKSLWFFGLVAAFLMGYALKLPAQGAAGRYQAMCWLVLPVCVALVLDASTTIAPVALRALGIALFGFILASSVKNTLTWRTAYFAHVSHIEEAHAALGRFLASLPDCEPILAYDIGAIAWHNQFCDRRIVDLGGMDDPTVIGVLQSRSGLFRLAKMAGARYLSLPLTQSARIDAPDLGLRVETISGRKVLVDPSGAMKLSLVKIFEPKYYPIEARVLVYNNAYMVGLWRIEY